MAGNGCGDVFLSCNDGGTSLAVEHCWKLPLLALKITVYKGQLIVTAHTGVCFMWKAQRSVFNTDKGCEG